MQFFDFNFLLSIENMKFNDKKCYNTSWLIVGGKGQ